MTPEEKTKIRIECIRLALQVPANQREYTPASLGGQTQLPRSKSTAEIIKDAEVIYEYIVKK